MLCTATIAGQRFDHQVETLYGGKRAPPAHLFKSKYKLYSPRHSERSALYRTMAGRLETGPIHPILTSPGLYWVLPLESCRHHEISFT